MWRIWRVAASQLCQLYHGMLHTGSYQWNNSRGVLNGMVPAWQEGLAARAATTGPSQLVVTARFDSPYQQTSRSDSRNVPAALSSLSPFLAFLALFPVRLAPTYS